jgi:tetratricopeptide (TPR) repeat protein
MGDSYVDYLALGKELCENGSYEAAVQALTVAITRNKALGDAYFYRGMAWQALGATVSATEDYDNAIRLGTTQLALAQRRLKLLVRTREQSVRFNLRRLLPVF